MPEYIVRAFVSYSHDSLEHVGRVRRFADRLRLDGVDSRLDQYVEAPGQGWPQWMADQIEAADFVLVVATRGYRMKAQNPLVVSSGLGVRFESVLLLQELYEQKMWNNRFIPILFRKEDEREIPRILKPYTFYRVWTEQGYQKLYRRLTNQPSRIVPALGEKWVLPLEVDEQDSTHPSFLGLGAKVRVGVFLATLLTVILLLVFLSVERPFRLFESSAVLGTPLSAGYGHSEIVPFEGRILHSLTGLPLEGVRVQLPDYGLQTLTDDLGVFRMSLKIQSREFVRVAAWLPGFAPLEREVSLGPGQNTWLLYPEANSE